MRIVAGILCAGLCCLQATAAGISDTSVPSEDELYQALIAGEIDFDQYQVWLEAIQYGIDPAMFDLEDLAADSLGWMEGGALPPGGTTSRKRPVGSLRYQYQSRLEDPCPSRTTFLLKVSPSNQLDVVLRGRKDYTTLERCQERRVVYTPKTGILKKLIAGTFARKFGLGTALGYRGKLFSLTDHSRWESLAYPDYGGLDGVCLEIGNRSVNASVVSSYHQSREFSIRTMAASLKLSQGKYLPELSIVTNQLKNRETDRRLNDHKAALALGIRLPKKEIAVEYCLQWGAQRAYGTLVGDASLTSSLGTVKFSGWKYDRSYLTLSSGGRSAPLSHRITVAPVELAYSDRRAGQTGLQIGVLRDLSSSVRVENRALIAWLHADSSLVQARSEIEWKADSQWTLGLQYLVSRRETIPRDSLFHRLRGSLRYVANSVRVRTTIGATLAQQGGDVLSWLTDLQVKPNAVTTMQFWSHLSRFIGGRIDYWSIFVKVSHRVSHTVELATKVAERYSARSSDRHQMTLTLELDGAI